MSLAGLTTAQRRAKREAYRRNALLAADEREKSLKCRWRKHSTMEGGCANDGSTCLCECHDL